MVIKRDGVDGDSGLGRCGRQKGLLEKTRSGRVLVRLLLLPWSGNLFRCVERILRSGLQLWIVDC